MATAAVLALHNAVVARLKAQCASCPSWYAEGAVTPGAAYPHGVVGGHGEQPDGFIGHSGSDNRIILRWFSDDRDDTATERGVRPVLAIWNEVFLALQGVTFTITGHTKLTCSVQLISTFRDQYGYRNAVAHLDVKTLTA